MYPLMINVSLLLVALCFCPCLASARVLRGHIVDPQGRTIAGARIALDCGGRTLKTRSGGDGWFALANVRASKSCHLSVSYPHFKILRKNVRLNGKPLLLELKLAPLRQAMTVLARSRGSSDGLGPIGGIDSASLSGKELRKVSNNTADLIAYAKLVAGAPLGPDDIYVDGLPAKVLPPAETISTITVNADPFSAEYSDGDANHIEITTGSADRKLHFNLGGGSLGLGGGSPLASGLHSSSHHFSPSVSAGVPHLPFTFSFNGNFGSDQSQQLVQKVVPSGSGFHSSSSIAPNGSSSDSGSLNLFYSKTNSTRAGLSYNQSSNKGWNSGVGGFTAPDAGSGTSFGSREIRAFLHKSFERWVWQTGMVFNSTRAHLWANGTAQNVNVPGYFEAGGSPMSMFSSAGHTWTWRTVFQSKSQKRFWTWGLKASRIEDADIEIPNPNGQIEFQSLGDYMAALGGALTGTLTSAKGKGHASHATLIMAPFVQGEIWRAGNFILRGGLRADYQSGGGLITSPRLSIASIFHGFVLRSGAGLFVHPWPNTALVHVLLNDGVHLQRFILTGVGYPALGDTAPFAGVPVVDRISPDFVRPRDIMLKESVERTIGNCSAGVEYTWVNGTHLLGSRRVASTSGWTDLLESNRRLRKHEIHLRAQYRWKGQDLIGNYEWVHSRDNTDGPFSFPEFQNDLRAEWAPSTGVPAHNASVVGNFRLPDAIVLTVLGSWHSSTPYTILTGKDVNGDGLFNDRGGLPRNSGHGPVYRSVSLYAYRHLSLGKYLNMKNSSFGTDIGIQIENVLGDRNYMTLNPVSSSPMFGKPLAAFPSRSVRLWFEFTP